MQEIGKKPTMNSGESKMRAIKHGGRKKSLTEEEKGSLKSMVKEEKGSLAKGEIDSAPLKALKEFIQESKGKTVLLEHEQLPFLHT